MSPPDNSPEPSSSAAPSSSSPPKPQALAPVPPPARGVTAKKSSTSTLQVVLIAVGTVIATVIGGIGLVAVAAFGLLSYTCSRH